MAKRKNKTKLVSAIVIAAVLVFAAVVTHFAFPNAFQDIMQGTGLLQQPVAEGRMRIIFVDVGQGDCTLISADGKTILIDAGEAGQSQNVINHLRNLGVRRIDCIIGTHPHSDHIGCMAYVMRAFSVGDVIIPEIPESITPTSVCYEKFLDEIERKAENAYYSSVGDEYSYGNMKFQVLGPANTYENLNSSSALNSMSVVIRLTYGETSVMLTGDACKESEADMLKNRYEFSADILKVGHHGSSSSCSDAWMNAVKPTYCVISCGRDNEYGHPHKATTDKLKKRKIEYFRTDLLGDIVFESDGKTFSRIIDIS